MNRDEKIANTYLTSLYSKVIYEPDGNIPPDFLLNDKIGVEVRRLNQQYKADGKIKGLEEDSIPLRRSIEEVLIKYPRENNKNTFWLGLSYSRSKQIKKSEIQKAIKSAILDFKNKNEITPSEYKISDNVWLTFLTKGNFKGNDKFKIGIETDLDSGGMVISIYVSNISSCINEKEIKIQPYKPKYKEWWLLLVDRIGYLDKEDVDETLSYLMPSNSFDKIILINVLGNKLILEINKAK